MNYISADGYWENPKKDAKKPSDIILGLVLRFMSTHDRGMSEKCWLRSSDVPVYDLLGRWRAAKILLDQKTARHISIKARTDQKLDIQ